MFFDVLTGSTKLLVCGVALLAKKNHCEEFVSAVVKKTLFYVVLTHKNSVTTCCHHCSKGRERFK